MTVPAISSAVGPGAAPKGTAAPKLVTAAKEFETVLLGQWLQGAESSFAAVPGEDSDKDAGGEQMQSFATQQLAASFTASGGVGIAKLVLGGLTKANEKEQGAASRISASSSEGRVAAATGALSAYKAEAM